MWLGAASQPPAMPGLASHTQSTSVMSYSQIFFHSYYQSPPCGVLYRMMSRTGLHPPVPTYSLYGCLCMVMPSTLCALGSVPF